MRKSDLLFVLRLVIVVTSLFTWQSTFAEPIFHEVHYPANVSGPVPAVIALHSSGGYASIKSKIGPYLAAGYAVYTPDFFIRHGITTATRFDTWRVHRQAIENELIEIVQLMKSDSKIDPRNLFAVGYSNGGYWTAFLAARGIVNAGVSHYGVWNFPQNAEGYPSAYFSANSHPVLALVGLNDRTQKPKFVLPEVSRAQTKSPSLLLKTYSAGHAWDCAPCKGDYIRDEAVTKDALASTLDFFKAHTQH